MLDSRSDYMASINPAGVAFSGFANSANRKVVCLGSSGNEYDLVGPGANQCRNLAPRTIDSRTRFLTKEVHARRIAEFFRQIWQHRLDHAPVGGRGSTVIQIDPACFCHSIDPMLPQCSQPLG